MLGHRYACSWPHEGDVTRTQNNQRQCVQEVVSQCSRMSDHVFPTLPFAAPAEPRPQLVAYASGGNVHVPAVKRGHARCVHAAVKCSGLLREACSKAVDADRAAVPARRALQLLLTGV